VGGPRLHQQVVPIEVTPVNDPPTAVNDVITTAEDTTLTVAAALLTNNDIPGPPDESGQTLQVQSVEPAKTAHGSVALSGGNIVYTPDPNFNGTGAFADSFTYSIDDGNGGTAVGTVTVDVAAVNDPPVPVNDPQTPGDPNFVTDEDTQKTISVSLLIGNDSPGPPAPAGTQDTEQSQSLLLTSVSPTSAKGGTVTLGAGGVTYAPPSNFNQINGGVDTFTYRVTDNGVTGGQPDPRDTVATATITVAAVNDGPQIAGPSDVSVDEDVTQAIRGLVVSDLDVGESNPNGPLQVTLNVSQGTLTVRTGVGLLPGDITGNDSSLVTIVGTPAMINSTLADSSGLTFTPTQDFNGRDTLTVAVNDFGETGRNDPSSPSLVQHQVTLTVSAVNDAPIITPVTSQQSVNEDTDLILTSITVTDEDEDETAGAELRVTLGASEGIVTVNTGLAGGLAPGQVTNNGTGQVTVVGSLVIINRVLTDPLGVTYRPNQDFFGQDIVTVAVSDLGNTGSPGAQTTEESITITVNATNDAPVANHDPLTGEPTIAVDEDSVLTVSGRGVLDNDDDVDGDVLTVDSSDSTSAMGAPVNVNPNGTFTYDPTGVAAIQRMADGDSLTDTFTYTASDGQLTSPTAAIVTVTVSGLNDVPVALDDVYTVNDNVLLDTSATAAINGVLANDSDPESDPLEVIVSASDTVSTRGATVTFRSNGNFVYDPTSSPTLSALQMGDPALVDTFTYTMDDDDPGNTSTSTATVTITVNGANSAPIAVSDRYTTFEDQMLIVPAPGILANDSDIDSAQLSAIPTPDPNVQPVLTLLGGTIQIFDNGGFEYDPSTSQTLRGLNDGESMDDSFAYFATDDLGGVASTTVTISVGGITDPPRQNQVQNTDVNGDGATSPIDALNLINYVNTIGIGAVPPGTRPGYFDVDGNNVITPADVLLVINYLNSLAQGGGGGEGESSVPATPPQLAAEADSQSGLLVSPGTTRWQDQPTGSSALVIGVVSGTGEGDAPELRPHRGEPAVLRPLARAQKQSAFDDLAVDRFDLEDALTNIAEELHGQEDGKSATDELIGRLFG